MESRAEVVVKENKEGEEARKERSESERRGGGRGVGSGREG